MGKHEEALVHLQEGLGIQLKLLGSEHLDVAASFNNLDGVYNRLGQYEQALQDHQKSLDPDGRSRPPRCSQ
jgi:tetratricopeptide (TPR) repeat protein